MEGLNHIGPAMSRHKQTLMKRPRRRPTNTPRRRSVADSPPADPPAAQRLQKVLAAAGVASRRECEQLILEGRVEVDGRLVTQLGAKADPRTSEIRVDGQVLPRTSFVYLLVNKPKGVVSTNRDPAGRPRVVDLVPEQAGRVFTVGRLDMESEGLLLLTNDGELANRLAHPRYGVTKKYQVQVAGTPGRELLDRLCQGVRLAEGFVRAVSARIKRQHKQSTILEIVLREGKNREIRRMLAAHGHKVQQLRRVAIGPLNLGQLPVGEYRGLTREELRRLRAATGTAGGRSAGKGRRK